MPTRTTWRDGAILLIAGRVDNRTDQRGEGASILADLVQDWDEAAALGPEAFARDVAAGDRGPRGRGGNGRRLEGLLPPGKVGRGLKGPLPYPAARYNPLVNALRRGEPRGGGRPGRGR